MSPEDEAALREMLAEPTQDLRSEGDPSFFADGAQIELFGLQGAKHLNGLTAEVVGYDNETRRYRCCLHTTEEVKQVAKKNMKAYTPPPAPGPEPPSASGSGAASAVFVPGASAGASSVVYVPGPSPGQMAAVPLPAPAPAPARPSEETALVLAPQAVPSRDIVKAAMAKVVRDTTLLHERCAARQMGIEGEGSICDVFLRLNTSHETFLEIYDLNKKHYGEDADLKEEAKLNAERFDEVVELYTTVRTWTELAQDEWNLTHYSISKHGFVGTLKNELIETGKDVVDLAADTGEVVTTVSSHVATHAPRLARAATTTVGGAVANGSTVVARAATSVGDRTTRSVGNVIEDQFVAPVKRAWHLLVTSFFLCFIIPLFALRTYAPMNSVVSNLGLVYSLMVLTCPPKWARGKKGKAGLLVLYPLVLVVLPLALHYWVMHPGSGPSGEHIGKLGKQLGAAAGQLGGQLGDVASRLRGSGNERLET